MWNHTLKETDENTDGLTLLEEGQGTKTSKLTCNSCTTAPD